MPTATGSVARGKYGEIRLYFIVDGTEYSFPATITPNVQPFTVATATLTYTDKSELTSTHTINGTIGKASIELSFDNGPSVKGDINSPTLSTNNTVSGSGTWTTL